MRGFRGRSQNARRGGRSYCLGRKWTRLPRLVANEFFPAFQTSEANLIEFIKARGRALDREQVSNGSLTHPPAISIPGNKAAIGDLPIASHKSVCAPDHTRKRARPIVGASHQRMSGMPPKADMLIIPAAFSAAACTQALAIPLRRRRAPRPK